ncbi:putative E7 protein [Etapapillomavirus 1]|uniref:E7 n=2 Tax=Fringilla coelebs papillomavirus TaxID=197771 RepID=A0A193DR10_FCPV|nr:putative E7 protein [Etapapillomavirus 1]AAL14226.1 putative E7 protein [Etapapillomavirus 1]ANN44253.1 E7 [Etapapillomavirus 1]
MRNRLPIGAQGPPGGQPSNNPSENNFNPEDWDILLDTDSSSGSETETAEATSPSSSEESAEFDWEVKLIVTGNSQDPITLQELEDLNQVLVAELGHPATVYSIQDQADGASYPPGSPTPSTSTFPFETPQGNNQFTSMAVAGSSAAADPPSFPSPASVVDLVCHESMGDSDVDEEEHLPNNPANTPEESGANDTEFKCTICSKPLTEGELDEWGLVQGDEGLCHFCGFGAGVVDFFP